MRFAVARSFVVAAFTTAAFANPKSNDASDLASIYLSPPASSHDGRVLSDKQARTILGHQLGLSQFYPVDDTLKQIIPFKNPEQELFAESDKHKSVGHYIFVTGAGSDFLASEDLAPAFKVPAQSSLKPANRFLNPDNSLLQQATELSGHSFRTTLEIPDFVDPASNAISQIATKDCITVDIVPGPSGPLTHAVPSLPYPTWAHFLAVAGSHGVHFDKSLIGDYVFGLSVSSLVSFLALPETQDAFMDGSVFITIPSLNWLKNEKTYNAATSFLKNVILGSALNSDPSVQSFIIVISPSKDAPTPQRGTELKRRIAEEIPISSIPPPNSHIPRPAAAEDKFPTDSTATSKAPGHSRIPRFFDSQKKCETQTNHCSTHGSCVKSNYPVANKWACKCKASGSTYWGGNACQKVDISIQFHMLLIISLIVLGAIGATIGAMLSMGSQQLPGVLTAGVAGKKA